MQELMHEGKLQGVQEQGHSRHSTQIKEEGGGGLPFSKFVGDATAKHSSLKAHSEDALIIVAQSWQHSQNTNTFEDARTAQSQTHIHEHLDELKRLKHR